MKCQILFSVGKYNTYQIESFLAQRMVGIKMCLFLHIVEENKQLQMDLARPKEIAIVIFICTFLYKVQGSHR